MGSSEEGKSCKPEKSSSPTPELGNIHVYPDWAAMQAYYGPRVTAPAYFNSTVAPGHAPHPYMWGPPQPMIPPYGAPYAAVYAHGGVYAPPGVPVGSHAQGHGVTVSPAVSEAMAVASLSADTSGKSSGNTDQGLIRKLKGFDGLAMSTRNGNTDNGEGGADQEHSQSADTEGSSDGSNAAGAGENNKKRSRETTPTDSDEKTPTRSYPNPALKLSGATGKVIGMAVSPQTVVGKVMGSVLSPNMSTGLEIKSPGANMKASPTNVPQLGPQMPNDAWLQSERELKRERRKQSNRESARRSRLRKQAEAEELAMRVQSLTAENMTLKSEINKLTESSDKLKIENAALMEKLKNEKLGKMEELSLGKIADKRPQPVTTVNLLARVDNSSSVNRNNDEEEEMYENNSSGTKLQLTDRSPRTDAVAAG
nr:transcriptional activator TAF-1 [Ipomoea batatas]